MTQQNIKLTPCQLKSLELLESESNVFLTGVAGSGKSYLLKYFMKDKPRKEFPIVASTGAAAVLVQGITFHSFFGLGILEGGKDKTVTRAMKDSRLRKRLERTKTLIIDEISMISGEALDTAEEISRLVRNNSKPWGGLRIIAVGDFGQLPPVTRFGQRKDWAFLSKAWQESQFKIAFLSTVQRTQHEEFLKVLNCIRNGIVSNEVKNFLNSKLKSVDQKFKGTRLFSHKTNVEDYNLEQLQKIKGKEYKFETDYSGKSNYIESLKKNCPIPEVLYLKKGALVMIRKNDPLLSYVNGSLGTLTEIHNDYLTLELLNGKTVTLEKEKFSTMDPEGNIIASAENFPLNLAWATTIHKSQGMTLDSASIDLGKVFEEGQAYVALSRIQNPDELYLSSWNENNIKASKEVANFHSQILESSFIL